MDDMPITPGSVGEPTVVRTPLTQHLVVGAVFVALGIGLGIAAPYVVAWGLAQPWLPFKGPLILLDQLADQFGSWLLLVVGGVAGLVIGFLAAADETHVEISARDITFVKGDKKQRFARSQIGTAVVDGHHLVLRDKADADLIRQKLDLPMVKVDEALGRHDWPTERITPIS
jgi:hypothetical protein